MNNKLKVPDGFVCRVARLGRSFLVVIGALSLPCLVAASSGCRSSQQPDVQPQLQAADILAKTTEVLQPTDQVTHLTADDKDRGINVEVWLDADGLRARADSISNGHRISEIITNGRTYEEIPSLSSANTPDALLSLALPWFISTKESLVVPIQSSTARRERLDGAEVLVVEEVTEGDDWRIPYSIWPSDEFFCPVRRILAVDSSSYLPVYFDVTLLCQSEGYPGDYHYHAVYSNIEFLDRDSVPEAQFSPEAARAEILDEELMQLKDSPFDVYWLGSELPDNLKITADDGLKDARTNWPSEEGEAAFFAYSQLHSTGNGLEIYEWPAGDSGLHCAKEWPVSGTKNVTTKFGPALYCDAGQHQLVLTAAGTMLRLEYSLGDAQWFVDRANALIPLE